MPEFKDSDDEQVRKFYKDHGLDPAKTTVGEFRSRVNLEFYAALRRARMKLVKDCTPADGDDEEAYLILLECKGMFAIAENDPDSPCRRAGIDPSSLTVSELIKINAMAGITPPDWYDGPALIVPPKKKSSRKKK